MNYQKAVEKETNETNFSFVLRRSGSRGQKLQVCVLLLASVAL